MAQTEAQELVVKQPSDRLKQAVTNCSLGFRKLADSIQDALRIGAEEGFSAKEIGIMVRQDMANNGFSLRTVQRYLPAEAKMQSKVRQQFGDNLSAKLRPQDYKTEDLPKYSKQFIIEVVHYLEQKYTIKQVVKQVEAIEPKPKLKLKQKPAQAQTSNNSKPYENWTNKALDNDKIQQIISLRKEGKYLSEIAKIVNTSKVSVIRYLKMNNIRT